MTGLRLRKGSGLCARIGLPVVRDVLAIAAEHQVGDQRRPAGLVGGPQALFGTGSYALIMAGGFVVFNLLPALYILYRYGWK